MKGLQDPMTEFVLNAIWQWRAIKKPCGIIIIILLKPRNDMIGYEPGKKRITPLQLSLFSHLQLSEPPIPCAHQERFSPELHGWVSAQIPFSSLHQGCLLSGVALLTVGAQAQASGLVTMSTLGVFK